MHVSDCFYSVVVQAVASSILIAVSVASSMPKRDNTLSDLQIVVLNQYSVF